MSKKLILCLGNPDAQYRQTRHNVGWLFGDYLSRQLQFSEPTLKRKFQALITVGQHDERQTVIAYPMTYMNDSGVAARKLTDFFALDPATDLLVVHDDLDIEVGNYKFTRKLPRTHNGLASVKQHLGTDDFSCLRLGVDDRHGSRQIPPQKYVLMNFPPEQLQLFEQKVFPAAFQETLSWL